MAAPIFRNKSRLAMVFAFCLPLLTAATALPQQPSDDAGKAAVKDSPTAKPAVEVSPVITHHELRSGGQMLRYTATVGLMPLKNEKGETEANIFFMAYTLDQPEADRGKRPLMFSFNGGPGSASVWLHLGAIGPRKVQMQPEGYLPAPPYHVVDNENTWLTKTDLVFIDPIGTGYSRVTKPELLKKYLGVKGDAAAVAEFIRQYLDRYERWSSPLFLVGESYGTTRASALSGYMLERYGVAFNGIVLVSSVLNFETLEFAPGNDLPYELYLPTYTATAWFHKKLDTGLQANLQQTLRQSEQFASGPYARALAKGDRLTPEERSAVLDGLVRFTGLGRTYLDQSDLRVEESHFTKELQRSSRLNTGRLDSRFTGIEVPLTDATSKSDPTIAAIRAPFTASFNQYVRTELGYKTDEEYYLLGGGFKGGDWEWGSAAEGFPNVAGSLRQAFASNPYMKLYVASGYFDLATPYYATEYTLAHLGLEPEEQKRVTTGYYDAGHMMYLRDASQKQLHDDVVKFIDGALHQTG